ncbi:MAG TPA: SAM-dependent DNA methyltransferase [Anaerolineae bacterium]|nr:SAM-dependent DNA methyltransferase [Anaerolineae bacterium]
MIIQQIKSRQRVADYGEVLTSTNVVNAMLDLVKQETERIDSRFLEPACGTGNFLTEILSRKLRVVEKKYRRSQLEFERNLVLAVSSIYGIDILPDNVIACRQRLFEIADEKYTALFKSKIKAEVRRTLRFILERNIVWGDALTLKTVEDPPQPIVFSEWTFPFHNSLLKRRDFIFAELIPDEPKKRGQLDLLPKNRKFSDLGEEAFIPSETHSYPPVHFLKLGEENDSELQS